MRSARLTIALLALSLAIAGCATSSGPDTPLTTAPSVDLDRYFGRWYIVANIPYFLEKGAVGSYAEFSRRKDGDIAEVYFAHDKSFDKPLDRTESHDYVVPNTGNARLRTSFLWPIYFTELILYVDPGYRYALIGFPGRSLGWVFARDPMIDDATYRSLLERMAAEGYDPAMFKRVPQTPDQIGKPGFQ